MDLAGIHIPTLVSGGVSVGVTFATVFKTFSHFDKIQSRTNRRFVSRWLLGLSVPQTEWNAFFTELFAVFFGPKHLSMQCVWRSLILSSGLVTAASLYVIYKHNELNTIQHAKEWATLYSILILTGCIVDYFSLWKTRIILTKVPYFRIWNVILTIGLDFAITTLVYCAFCVFFQIEIYDVHFASWDGIFGTVFLLVRNILIGSSNFSLFYCVTLLTSAWLWAYLLVNYIMRGVSYIPGCIRKLSKIADLQEHPVRTLGFVTAAFSAGVVSILNSLLG
jgi:hypothetical protein